MESRTKTYLVKSSFFELKIFWNGTLVKTQGAALLALLLVAIFGSNTTLRNGCIALIVLDIIFIFFLLCKDVKVKELKPKQPKQSDEEDSTPTKITKETVASIEKSPTKAKQRKKSDKPEPEIKNKVGVPKQVADDDGFASITDEPSASDVTANKTKNAEEMTAEDWAQLFGQE